MAPLEAIILVWKLGEFIYKELQVLVHSSSGLLKELCIACCAETNGKICLAHVFFLFFFF